MQNKVVVRPKPDVIARRLGSSVVLVDLQTNRIYELNQTGARIWELVVEGHDLEAIETTLQAEFDTAAVNVRDEIARVLRDVRAEGLIDVDDGR